MDDKCFHQHYMYIVEKQSKGIIIFIVVFIYEFTQNTPTKINLRQGIFN